MRSDTDRDGEARLGPLAGLITVDAVAEGADAGGERREGEVVVVPLPKQGHHVSELSVVDDAGVRRVQDVVGHLSHLRDENKLCGFFLFFETAQKRPLGKEFAPVGV